MTTDTLPRSGLATRLTEVLQHACLLAAFLGFWELAAQRGWIDATFTGQPSGIGRFLWSNLMASPKLWVELGWTLLGGLDEALRISAVGSPATVRTQLSDLIQRYQPDEVILTGQIHDPEARRNSFRIAAEVMETLQKAPA